MAYVMSTKSGKFYGYMLMTEVYLIFLNCVRSQKECTEIISKLPGVNGTEKGHEYEMVLLNIYHLFVVTKCGWNN